MMPDFVRHSQATPDIQIRSREEFKRFDEEYKATFPDAKITVHFVLAEGDKLGAYMTFTGTQEGEMGPFPPSGRTVESKFLGIMRLDGGKIAEMWVEWDNLAMLAQLGHFPPVGTEQ
jgi:predicted ester cyclase